MNTYTFIIRINLNRGTKSGNNNWEVVVYRKGNDEGEAVAKINEDFDTPFIIAVFEGEHKPLKGFAITSPTDCPLRFEGEHGYKLETR